MLPYSTFTPRRPFTTCQRCTGCKQEITRKVRKLSSVHLPHAHIPCSMSEVHACGWTAGTKHDVPCLILWGHGCQMWPQHKTHPSSSRKGQSRSVPLGNSCPCAKPCFEDATMWQYCVSRVHFGGVLSDSQFGIQNLHIWLEELLVSWTVDDR